MVRVVREAISVPDSHVGMPPQARIAIALETVGAGAVTGHGTKSCPTVGRHPIAAMSALEAHYVLSSWRWVIVCVTLGVARPCTSVSETS